MLSIQGIKTNKQEKLPYNILVTASGLSPVGINTVLSIRNKVRKIIGIDIDTQNTAKYFVDKFYTVPLAKNEEYFKKILAICKQEKIDALFPLTIEELLVLLKNADRLNQQKIKIIGESNYNNVKICNDKWLTNKYLKDNNQIVPTAFSPKSISELIDDAKKLGYPAKQIVVKPRITHGSRGFRILDSNYDKYNLLIKYKPTDNIFLSLKELTDTFKKAEKFPEIILMDYLKGDDYSVYLFCRKGKTLSAIPMKRTGFIPGMSTGGIIQNNVRVIKYVKNIAEAFNFSGLINIQLIMTQNGPMLYEINTRVSATTIMTIGTGLNYPLLAILQTFGCNQKVNEIISNTKIKWGTELYRIQKEIFKYKNNYFDL